VIRDKKPRFFYGYVILVASLGIQGIIWGIFNSFGVFFMPLQAEFGWSRAMISAAVSFSMLLHGLVAIIMGGLNDRFGPKLIMAICGLFFGLGHLLMSQLNAAWQLYLFFSVLVGIGISATDVVLLSTIARWFVKKRGLMSGIVKAGTGMGLMIMPLVASKLISASSWRTSYIILGILALVFAIPIAQLLRRDPGQMGQLPDGEKEVTISSLDSVERGLSLGQAIHTKQFWIICGVYFTICSCVQTILVHIVPYATDLGISATNAASILSTIGGASIAGRLVMGSAGDSVGNKRAMLVCFLILVAILCWLQWAKELWMLYLFAVAYGFSHGGFFALISPMAAELFGTRSHGAIFGIVIFSGTIGSAISPILAGHIFDITYSYWLAFLTLTALSIIGLILTILIRPTNDKGGGNDSRRST